MWKKENKIIVILCTCRGPLCKKNCSRHFRAINIWPKNGFRTCDNKVAVLHSAIRSRSHFQRHRWPQCKIYLWPSSRVKTTWVSVANDVLSNKYIITRLIEKRGKNKVKLPIDWLRTIEIISRIIKRLSDTNERFFIFLGG